MNARQRNLLLIALALLLFLIAGVQVWPAIVNWHNHAQVEQHAALGLGHGPLSHKTMHGKGGPLAELGLSPEQHKQIEAIMQETIQKERAKFTPSDSGAKSGPKAIQIPIPMERIRSVLTPEQRVKLDDMEKRMKAHFASPGPHDVMLPPPGHAPSPMLYLHQDS
jgi:Spy/CpxP family protein refolding chaperone